MDRNKVIKETKDNLERLHDRAMNILRSNSKEYMQVLTNEAEIIMKDTEEVIKENVSKIV